jgi:hypothetical protein
VGSGTVGREERKGNKKEKKETKKENAFYAKARTGGGEKSTRKIYREVIPRWLP